MSAIIISSLAGSRHLTDIVICKQGEEREGERDGRTNGGREGGREDGTWEQETSAVGDAATCLMHCF